MIPGHGAWAHVDDAFPVAGETVLLYCHIPGSSENYALGYWTARGWCITTSGASGAAVIAWRHLPRDAAAFVAERQKSLRVPS